MKKVFRASFLSAMLVFSGHGVARMHWRASDGLPTGEIRQIVELPDGAMLINCEGVFCMTNGHSFDVLTCNQNRCFLFPEYAEGYGQQWQGDSLLWLHDFYRVYLFDTRTRSFRYDISERLAVSSLNTFFHGKSLTPPPTEAQWRTIAANGIMDVTVATGDRHGGTWVGTRFNGIYYCLPERIMPRLIATNDSLIDRARGTADAEGRVWRCRGDGLICYDDGVVTKYDCSNVPALPHNPTTFIHQLSERRYLLCDSLCLLGYFVPETREFSLLNDKIPQLSLYRHIVGACHVGDDRVALYTQNGICVLNTRADSIETFPAVAEIERYSSKYNCMLRDYEGTLWVGTQNGLFRVRDGRAERIGELRNNCIRSLVADVKGNVWAGTSCGISRVTPTVVNLGESDGVPEVTMMERAACLTDDGSLVFVYGGKGAVVFRPEEILHDEPSPPVIFTRIEANRAEKAVSPDIELAHDSSTVSIHFSTLNYASLSRTSYRYRLRGMDERWSTDNDGRGAVSVTYTILPPGDYTFEAQARTTSEQWGPVASLHIIVCPPLWLTPWAKVLYCILLLATAVCLARVYVRRRQRKMERDNEERVNRLFELREEARRRFADSTHITPQNISVNAEEERLVSRMLEVIGEHMSDEDYGVDQLASDVAMSRTSLYSKLKTMLGVTPADFMRNVRLKHAATLLAETNLSVNDIASRVGFATARNFSVQFRRMFGVLPSKYREG